MADLLNGLKRTKMCGEFNESDIDKEVVIMGFVSKFRDLGSLIFMDIRDRTGIIQISISNDSQAYKKASTIRTEYVVCVKGVVKSRGSNINKNIKTGSIEVIANEVRILSYAQTTPFEIKDDVNAQEQLRLKYRYLDLRRPFLQNKLIVRDKITKAVRNTLSENGFIEVETPFLGKSTPEGARDYLVPSRIHKGAFYALPQSPQIYKQLLMISGIDRYYQIARCFRDEDLRANRQPEFSQIDLEMSYVEKPEDVMEIAEKVIRSVFKECLNFEFPNEIRKLTYKEAMDRFGSDKPDTRFGLEIKDITNIIKESEFSVFKNACNLGGGVFGINVKNLSNMTRKEIDSYQAYAKSCGVNGLAYIALKEENETSSFLKFISENEKLNIYKKMEAEKGDILFFIADTDIKLIKETLGFLRIKIAEDKNLIDKKKIDILWIKDFPLLEFDKEENRYVAVHHPFTAPNPEDIELLDKNPELVRASAYDLVINGQEVGGGSIRIHDYKMQEKMFEKLGFSKEDIKTRFGFFVDAFKYGAPPHGGLAFGLDRLVMIITGTDNIKDVIAFPKIQNASCLMTEAPSIVEDKQLNELFIKIDN